MCAALFISLSLSLSPGFFFPQLSRSGTGEATTQPQVQPLVLPYKEYLQAFCRVQDICNSGPCKSFTYIRLKGTPFSSVCVSACLNKHT